MWKVVWKIFLLFSASVHTGSEITTGDEGCMVQDLCRIDTEECLRSAEDEIQDCYDFGYSKVYKDRTSESSFRITSRYTKNRTFSVVEIQSDKYETVSSCCNLKLNETCLLPKRSQKDSYFRIYSLRDGREFCSRTLDEYPPESLEFCRENDPVVDNCISMENGVFVIKLKYYDASLEKISMDYCFFEMPVAMISERNERGLSKIDDEIVSVNSSWIRINGYQEEKCRIENGQIHIGSYASKNKPKDGYELCFTAKVRNKKEWEKKAWCTYSERDWTLAYTLVIAAGATFTLGLAMFLIYKMKLKKFVSSYTKSEIPFQDNIAHIDENCKFLEECESYMIPEIPDVITFGDGERISPAELAGEAVNPQLHQDDGSGEVNDKDDDTCSYKIKLLHGTIETASGVESEGRTVCPKERDECLDFTGKDDGDENQSNLSGSKHPCLLSSVNTDTNKADYSAEKGMRIDFEPGLTDYVKKSMPPIATFNGYVQKV